MIENLPPHIALVFILATWLTLGMFYWSIHQSKSPVTKSSAVKIALCLIIWLVLQTVLTFQNVYNTDTETTFPPKLFLFGFLPNLIVLVALFATKSGREFTDSLSLKYLTWLHVIRIPVEIVLYWLFLNQAVPDLMTFEGRNFDVISGITAPLVAYFVFSKRLLGWKALLTWNILCLGLLVNIVTIAILSAPFPFQQLALGQPDMAILNFPFSWLPTFVVPVVLYGHLASIRQLIQTKNMS